MIKAASLLKELWVAVGLYGPSVTVKDRRRTRVLNPFACADGVLESATDERCRKRAFPIGGNVVVALEGRFFQI